MIRKILSTKCRILHIHWVNLYAGINEKKQALSLWKLLIFITDIFLVKLFRIKIVWTIHNLYNHECSRPYREQITRRFFSKIVDSIICHCDIAKNKIQVNKEPNDIYALTTLFGNSERQNLEKWKQNLNKLSKKGKIAIWGAGAKGVTFCNLIDPTSKMINCVIDLNPNKQGKYIPGTGHSIIDYSELQSRNITSIILMNPNYNDEVKELLQKSNQSIDLIK